MVPDAASAGNYFDAGIGLLKKNTGDFLCSVLFCKIRSD